MGVTVQHHKLTMIPRDGLFLSVPFGYDRICILDSFLIGFNFVRISFAITCMLKVLKNHPLVVIYFIRQIHFVRMTIL